MSGHQSAASDTEVWLTPPEIIRALGQFDLDPCAATPPRPWGCATENYVRADNGLMKPWSGRVWLNPPYGGPLVIGPWMRRMVEHNHGTALIFARTETALFAECVWARASAILFIRGRLYFHHANGRRARANAGAPSCLVAFGEYDAERLDVCGLPGQFIGLRAPAPAGAVA